MTVKKPLISIIASFYNLEGYVKRCVNSILEQTYENIEVILVDDGSSDQTANILDEYSNLSHVSVIHTPNRGPGAARNTGVRSASGAWIMYVDGDDYLYPWSAELLMQCAVSGNFSVVIGGYDIVMDKRSSRAYFNPVNINLNVFDKAAVVKAFMLEEITESPWAKAIRADLAKAHPFPEGCWYEDVMWAPGLYLSCGIIGVINISVYAYVMRSNSVVHRKCGYFDQANDFMTAIDAMTELIAKAYPDLRFLIAYRRALELARLHALLKSIKNDPQAKTMDKACLSEIRLLVEQFKDNADIPLVRRKRLELIAKAPVVHDCVLYAYEKILKGQRGVHR